MKREELQVNPDKPFMVVGKDCLCAGILTRGVKVLDTRNEELIQIHIDHLGDEFTVFGEFATWQEADDYCEDPRCFESLEDKSLQNAA